MTKTTKKKTVEKVDWSDVTNMLLTIETVIRNVAGGTLLLKEKPNIYNQLTDEGKTAITEIAQRITPIVESLKVVAKHVPPPGKGPVTEEAHPTYLYLFTELIDIHQCAMEQLVLPFAVLKEAISDIPEATMIINEIEKDKLQ
jgi:hypothetical protein